MKKTLLKSLAVVGISTIAMTSAGHSALINGGFEAGDLSSWSVLGSAGASTGVNYGAPGTVSPYAGNYAALLNTSGASAFDIAATMGVSEATLEASNGGTDATNGSLIYQTTTANAGDTFSFRWNFVEQDYVPYDDWAFYGISYNGAPADVTKFASLATVGPGSGTTVNGWVVLNVSITLTGTYTFYFGVVNALDTQLDSRLWIDGAYAASTPPPDSGDNVPDGGSTLAMLGLAMTAVAGLRRKFAV